MIFKWIDQSLAFQWGCAIDLQDGIVMPSGFSMENLYISSYSMQSKVLLDF